MIAAVQVRWRPVLIYGPYLDKMVLDRNCRSSRASGSVPVCNMYSHAEHRPKRCEKHFGMSAGDTRKKHARTVIVREISLDDHIPRAGNQAWLFVDSLMINKDRAPFGPGQNTKRPISNLEYTV